MERRALGRTGTSVSRLILGCAGFGGFGSDFDLAGRGEDDAQAAAIMDAAWEYGIDTFDTADAYGGGRSEQAIGKWIRSRGVQPILTTKTFHPMAPGEDRGLGPARIRRQVESSLGRLGVDRIDLYLTHEPDPETSLAETLDVLDELVAEGKIGAYGGSHLTADLLEQADGRYGWVQNSLSLLDQGDAHDVLPLVETRGLGYTPYSPLSGGWLTGKYRRGATPPAESRMGLRPGPYEELDRDDVWQGIEQLRRWTNDHGIAMANAAYAWVLADSRVTAMLIGPRRPEQLASAVWSMELDLSPDDHALLASFFTPAVTPRP